MPSSSRMAVRSGLGADRSAELAGWQRGPCPGSTRPPSDWWPHAGSLGWGPPILGEDTPILLGAVALPSSWGSHMRAKGLEKRGLERKKRQAGFLLPSASKGPFPQPSVTVRNSCFTSESQRHRKTRTT